MRTKGLALPKHQPYLIRWVKEFLHFAREHGDYSFEQTLDLFLAEVGGRVGVKPWQIQHAADAVRIYRYQYRGAGRVATSTGSAMPAVRGDADDRGLLARMREIIRLGHYSRSTEKTSLHWSRRFLDYRRRSAYTGNQGLRT